VRAHGYRLFVEDVTISAWARTWGRGVAAFTPGTLVAAIDREARAVAAVAGGAGGVIRIPTQITALSQHCPCGARVEKSLADRVHRCPSCGLTADRDAVSAVLGAFLVLEPDELASCQSAVSSSNRARARVDYHATRQAREAIRNLLSDSRCTGRQDARSESNDLFAGEPSFAWRTSTPAGTSVARRIVGTATGPTPDEPGYRQTTPERTRWRTDLTHNSPLGELWDNS